MEAEPGNRAAADDAAAAPPARQRRLAWSSIIAWIILIGALVLPPHGAGIPLCPSKYMTGVPCPGCGLTRSVTCLAHAQFESGWSYHPFGIGVLVVALWYAFVPIVAPDLHHRVAHSRFVRRVGLVILIAFVLHGFIRAGLWMAGVRSAAGAP